MRRTLELTFILIVLSLCAGCARTVPPDDLGPIGDFSLTERDGQTVTNADLAGKVWVASFVFTRCTGPCPQISGTMARLQQELPAEVVLVTITADPDRDDADELKKYAEQFGADPERWLFLTGPRDAIRGLSEKGFHLALGEDRGEIMHSTKLVLVDRRGHIRGYYDGRSVDDIGQPVDEVPTVKRAVADLLRESP
jgi:cytochrome oxidase Cu insertion factor (SCO1/SenC/PrrC family)